jgi:hypothetical protein
MLAQLIHSRMKTGSQMMSVVAAAGRQRGIGEQPLGQDEVSNAKTVQVSLDRPLSPEKIFLALQER